MEKDREIEVKLKDGSTAKGEILFTFEANGDDFVLYAINDEVFASKVDEENNLSPVEEDEWPLVEKVFNEFMEEMEGEDEASE